MKRYACQICKEERMFSLRRKLCGRCVRIYGSQYGRNGDEA